MSKSLNKRISTPLAIITIVLCTLIVGGILAWYYLGVPKEKAKPPEEKISEEKEEVVPEDKIADWKTYTGKEYGFEIKYPDKWEMNIGKSWYVEEEEEIYGLIKGKVNQEQYDCAFEILMDRKIPISKIILEETSVKFEDKEDIFIGNNLSATKLYNYEYPNTQIYLLKEKNNKGYYFKIAISAWESFPGPIIVKKHKCGKIFDQMLSTFRFLE